MITLNNKKKGKVHPCTGCTAYRGNRGIALLFHDHGTRRGWGVSVMPQPLFTPRKDPVPIVQEAGWAPGPVWTGAENLTPTGIRFPDRPACSQSLYRLSYLAHTLNNTYGKSDGTGSWYRHTPCIARTVIIYHTAPALFSWQFEVSIWQEIVNLTKKKQNTFYFVVIIVTSSVTRITFSSHNLILWIHLR
jgi:hypothetical protein